MKRFALFVMLFIVILSGCSGKAYEESLQNGYDLLKEAKYKEASEQFSIALENKETEEANKGKLVADAMFAGWDSFRAGIFNSAVEIAHNVLIDDHQNKAVSLVVKDAEKLLEQAGALLELYNDISEKIQTADGLSEDKQFEEALQIYEDVIVTEQDHFMIENLVEDTKDKIEKVKTELKKNVHQNNPVNENDAINQDGEKSSEDNQKNNEEKENKQISPDEAEDIIRNALNIPNGINVNHDHDEGNFYIIQVFEIVENDEINHTATWGWYKVNKSTGEWTEAF